MVIAQADRMAWQQRLEQMRELADAHLSIDQIVERTGLSRSSVRVYLCQARSRPRLSLSDKAQSRWRQEARHRGVPSRELMARALELIATDNLFSAVLDT
jgi:hypothetical protein